MCMSYVLCLKRKAKKPKKLCISWDVVTRCMQVSVQIMSCSHHPRCPLSTAEELRPQQKSPPQSEELSLAFLMVQFFWQHVLWVLSENVFCFHSGRVFSLDVEFWLTLDMAISLSWVCGFWCEARVNPKFAHLRQLVSPLLLLDLLFIFLPLTVILLEVQIHVAYWQHLTLYPKYFPPILHFRSNPVTFKRQSQLIFLFSWKCPPFSLSMC